MKYKMFYQSATKKVLVLLSFVFIVTSCQQDVIEPASVGETSIAIANEKSDTEFSSFEYTDKELLNLSDKILNNRVDIKIFEENQNNSTGLSVDDSFKQGATTTKGSNSVKKSIALIYNEVEGKAIVLSRDKRIFPILAYFDSKNVKYNDYESIFKAYLNNVDDVIKQNIDSIQDVVTKYDTSVQDINDVIEDYFDEFVSEKPLTKSRNRSHEGTFREILGREDEVYGIDALVKTAWSQEYNYRKTIGRNPRAEGCVATAVNQILYHWRDRIKSITIPRKYGTLNGKVIQNVAYQKFDNYPLKYQAPDSDRVQEIRDAVSQVLTIPNGDERIGYLVSISDFESLFTGFEHYAKSKMLSARHWINSYVDGLEIWDHVVSPAFNAQEDKAILSVDRRNPVIMGGGTDLSGSNAHAWIIDGHISVRVKRGVWFVTWTEHRSFIHINWGWGIENNGWYFYNYKVFVNKFEGKEGKFYRNQVLIRPRPTR